MMKIKLTQGIRKTLLEKHRKWVTRDERSKKTKDLKRVKRREERNMRIKKWEGEKGTMTHGV